MKRPRLFLIFIFAMMKRNLPILIFLLSSVVLAAQPEEEVKPRTIKQWNLSADLIDEVTIPFDTVFSLFHRYRLSDRYSSLNATLGNYGLPFYQINFFDRVTDPDKFLYTGFYPFLFVPEKAVFMNTQVPFSEMVWTYGAPRETAEQTFRVRHSQNVNRNLNFGLIFDVIYNLGQYNYQKTDNKTFTFYGSYTGSKYKAYFSTGVNNLNTAENGGIIDKNHLKLYETREVPVNMGSLNSSKSILKNNNLLLVQRYKVGGTQPQSDTAKVKRSGIAGLSGTFSHILTWETNRRTYIDKSPGSGFYKDTLINGNFTRDSLSSRMLKNTIRFDFMTDESKKLRLGIGVGLRNELIRYGQIIPSNDVITADTAGWIRNNNVLIGRILNDIGDKFGWIAVGELFLTGYRAGDFSLKGEITKKIGFEKGTASWIINGAMTNTQPSFWMENWGSNNFKWQNNLKKVFRIDVGTIFSYPVRKAEIRFNYAIIDNFTAFNSLALPDQYQSGLSVASLNAKKEMKAWKFHLNTDLLIQKSSNSEILDLPLITTKTAFFFEHLFRFKETNGDLNTQLGVEVLYHTDYYPYSYMPATGRFYRQNGIRAGNYPFIDVFLNFKLRRTRVFIMYDHLNSGYMGYDYFMTPDYPMNTRMLRYGLAWTFYN